MTAYRTPDRLDTAMGYPVGGGRLIHRAAAKPHHCQPPGWWLRFRNGIEDGALWQCDTCQKYWAYEADQGIGPLEWVER